MLTTSCGHCHALQAGPEDSSAGEQQDADDRVALRDGLPKQAWQG